MAATYKNKKRGAGRHVQLSEALQSTEAWADLKPGPRALYIALKRRYNGQNNGRIMLSHREAAIALNVNRNTIGGYYQDLIDHGFVRITEGYHLGPNGIGQTAKLALTELHTVDGKPATHDFRAWKKPNEKKDPRHKNRQGRPEKQDTQGKSDDIEKRSVIKIVTGG